MLTNEMEVKYGYSFYSYVNLSLVISHKNLFDIVSTVPPLPRLESCSLPIKT